MVAQWQRLVIRRRRQLRAALFYLFLAVIVGVFIVPLYWTVISSFKKTSDLFSEVPQWLPQAPTLASYAEVLSRQLFLTNLANSFFVASATTIFAVILGGLAAYSLSRYGFPGREAIGQIILFATMVPAVLLVIPLYKVMAQLNLLNSLAALVLSYTSFALPFSTWMFRGYFRSIPRDLDDAALIDGCTRPEALFRVIIPVSLPGMAAVATLAFLTAWREFLFALVFIDSEELKTITLAIANFIVRLHVDWGAMLAGGTIAMIPILIVFMFFQRYIVEGLTAGAVK